ncbi:hypothetical protein M431DRAFT_266924 [Trichoderma harzianum CBS 226.95]|uniref:Uncharacterized protein n=1 Tax=Trichoderma harzianum CBS 226.95 TaxID=983964 RepID=A0A2T3ZYI7_TRIHA|nr:hypothetical protein M431DRAFT_266924 [Trichoderma harzianum CBS 226.95]PTB49803.1 hypothetical protein M431DRAFT_266924 [Trichoderma harzianum CBS 226.95]
MAGWRWMGKPRRRAWPPFAQSTSFYYVSPRGVNIHLLGHMGLNLHVPKIDVATWLHQQTVRNGHPPFAKKSRKLFSDCLKTVSDFENIPVQPRPANNEHPRWTWKPLRDRMFRLSGIRAECLGCQASEARRENEKAMTDAFIHRNHTTQRRHDQTCYGGGDEIRRCEASQFTRNPLPRARISRHIHFPPLQRLSLPTVHPFVRTKVAQSLNSKRIDAIFQLQLCLARINQWQAEDRKTETEKILNTHALNYTPAFWNSGTG